MFGEWSEVIGVLDSEGEDFLEREREVRENRRFSGCFFRGEVRGIVSPIHCRRGFYWWRGDAVRHRVDGSNACRVMAKRWRLHLS